jgi:hypothetical protein
MRIPVACREREFTTGNPDFFPACLTQKTKFFIKFLFLYTVKKHEYQIDFYPVLEGIVGL